MRNSRSKALTLLLTIYCCLGALGLSIALAETPEWAKSGTLERSGQSLKVVCIGSAPSLDLARAEALASCRNSAIGQLQNKMTIRSESIESERDVLFHQETKQLETYSGLQCFTEKEALDTSADQVKVFLKCRYDLAKVIVVSGPSEQETSVASGPVSLIANQESLDELPSAGQIAKKSIIQSEAVQVVIASVPKCDSILIHSKRPARVVRCTENPQTVLVHTSSDYELIVRAKGYLPKVIPIQRRSPASLETEVIHVYFQRP